MAATKTVSDHAGCQGCPMRQLFPTNPYVEPRWGTGLRLAIADAPHASGAYMVGEGWLRGVRVVGGRKGGMYQAAGIRDGEITFCNVIQCLPPEGIFPTDPKARRYIAPEAARMAVAHCVEHNVEPILRARHWTRIDLLGDKPLRWVAQRKESISTLRGSPIPIPLLGNATIAIPTLHPLDVARDQIMMPVVVNDLMKSTQMPPEHYQPHPALGEVRELSLDRLTLDIETDRRDTITMVGVSGEPFKGWCLPFSGEYKSELQRLVAGARDIITHNGIGFDLPFLQRNGVEPGPDAVLWDTMLMHHLLFPDFPHDLEFLGRQFTTKGAWKSDKASMEVYNLRDVDVTTQSWLIMEPRLRQLKMESLYHLVSVPAARICLLMHETGMKIDPARVVSVREKLQAEMQELEAQLPEPLRSHERKIQRRELAPPGTVSPISGRPLKYRMVDDTERIVPWRSDAFKKKYLYDELGLEEQFNPKKAEARSVDKSAMDKLIRKYGRKLPWLSALRRIGIVSHLLSGFCQEEKLSAGRIHPRFNVHGTCTGRLSSANPNFQNQPETARYMYVPSHPDWVLVSADYSGIENRLTAWFADDKERLARFETIPGFNEHRWVAAQIEGCPEDQIEKDNSVDAPYGRAKRINHGLNYGLGVRKISMMYGIPESEVRKLVAFIKTRCFPRTVQWQERITAEAKSRGFLTNPFGRRRWFWTQRAFTESLAFLPQSTAADIILRAMIGLMYERSAERFKLPIERLMREARQVCPKLYPLPRPANLLLQCHDQLLVETPAVLVPDVVAALRTVMEQPWPELGGFVLPVTIEWGDDWGSLEPLAC